VAKSRTRTQRRAAERELQKLEDAREKLSRISPGGTPENPLEVQSASVIELAATALGCNRCAAEVRVEAHEAIVTSSGGERRVVLRCKSCGHLREVFVRLSTRTLN
jgi:hypothetical protein